MLIMAIIAALTPTLFYQMYGSVSANIYYDVVVSARSRISYHPMNSLNFDALAALIFPSRICLHALVVIMIK
jgi:hypothetical protein